jgi:hypothetical protein
VLAISLIAIFLPSSTAKVESAAPFLTRIRTKFSRETLLRVDVLGAFSLLAASVLLVFALESGGAQYAWASAAVIPPLALSAFFWIVFVAWEIYLERSNMVQEPILPLRLLKKRQLAAMML